MIYFHYRIQALSSLSIMQARTVGVLLALASAVQSQLDFTSNGCVDPGNFDSCWSSATSAAQTCYTQNCNPSSSVCSGPDECYSSDQNCVGACTCVAYQSWINCALSYCWNRVRGAACKESLHADTEARRTLASTKIWSLTRPGDALSRSSIRRTFRLQPTRRAPAHARSEKSMGWSEILRASPPPARTTSASCGTKVSLQKAKALSIKGLVRAVRRVTPSLRQSSAEEPYEPKHSSLTV